MVVLSEEPFWRWFFFRLAQCVRQTKFLVQQEIRWKFVIRTSYHRPRPYRGNTRGYTGAMQRRYMSHIEAILRQYRGYIKATRTLIVESDWSFFAQSMDSDRHRKIAIAIGRLRPGLSLTDLSNLSSGVSATYARFDCWGTEFSKKQSKRLKSHQTYCQSLGRLLQSFAPVPNQ